MQVKNGKPHPYRRLHVQIEEDSFFGTPRVFAVGVSKRRLSWVREDEDDSGFVDDKRLMCHFV